MADKEVIDLTTDDREIIIVESGDESHERPTKRARKSPLGPTSRGDTQEMMNVSVNTGAGAEDRTKKFRRPGKKKRKKVTVVGDEDGEIIELEAAEDSGAVSRDDSREQTDAEGQSRDAPERASKTRAKDSVIRSLLDRLADAEDIPTVYAGDSLHRLDSDSRERKKRKKKRKRRDSDRERTTTASTTNPDSAAKNAGDKSLDSDLFFIDETPAVISADAKLSNLIVTSPSTPATSNVTEKADEGGIPLLLPVHVSVSAGDHADESLQLILPPSPDSEDEAYIEYLDYDDDRRAPGVARYFDDPADGTEPKTAKIVCKKCGAEGDHKTWNCPVIICLTCGVRNEHGTRSCPISKVCFTCGMKGHINRDCPNRYAGRARMGGSNFDDCDRCGSSLHQINECPTLWRIYTYVEEPERLEILAAREQKRELEIGEGGEGYIGPEDWCYDCGECGHLGDDCKTRSHHHDRPSDPSAFGTYNINTGPFADAKNPQQRKPGKAASYAARMNDAWGDGYGHVLPLDVGKQGRKKERARMERRAQEVQADDADDWFAKRRGGNSREKGGGSGGGGSKGSRNGRINSKISFSDFDRDGDRFGGRDRRDGGRPRLDDLPGPSRESDSIKIRGASRRDKERERRDRDDEWDGSIRGAARRQSEHEYDHRRNERPRDDRDRYGERDRRRERDRREASPRREPRYRGGYAR
ncbi:uncharacterized protein PHACADRAFT_250735 [Phanerochaete carnosa HHB-10118-sp]|uniref:CCHC-type domain-containing protein n=1 Tax=Phanerochaete carnosa (strain HHB-10118-sp) TaxID=650164 RepID=K5XAI1_PHACS|nr:uncharacterized protein PHACADRAFT_250735 [Phanerochaete carnosa HHB-10118-sp]EKM59927.1 hypothetical protein PHACADRAFT_250735 [Phanerochaete carnosa HHB-10118-sp]